MPAHPIFEDLKAVQFNLDREAREQLVDLVRAERSNGSAVVRRLIAHAHAAFLCARLNQNQELTPHADEKVAA